MRGSLTDCIEWMDDYVKANKCFCGNDLAETWEQDKGRCGDCNKWDQMRGTHEFCNCCGVDLSMHLHALDCEGRINDLYSTYEDEIGYE